MKIRVKTLEQLKNNPDVLINYNSNNNPSSMSYKKEFYRDVCQNNLFGKVGTCREGGNDENEEMTYYIINSEYNGTVPLFCVEEFIEE